jgi:hypothetical protein
MADFFRTEVDDRSFIRGAARLLYAPITTAAPTQISDIIHLASGAGVDLYDPVYTSPTNGWVDLGATKTGIQISVNNTEETFDVDQIYGDIDSLPTNWEVSVGTQLAEFTPEKLQICWEGSEITTANSEQSISFGAPTSYTRRRLAVLFQRPNGKIRAYSFRKVQRLPQESTVTHNKTGEQISVPVQFRVLPDFAVTDPKARFFTIYDQELPA